MHKQLAIYWKKKKISIKEENDYKDYDIHDLYPEFSRSDNLSFIRLFIGVCCFLIIRSILAFLIFLTLMIVMKITMIFSEKLSNYICRGTCLVGSIILGVIPITKKLECKDLYEEWFGKDYNTNNYDSKYAYIVSNHFFPFEVWYYVYKFSCSFIAKSSIQNLPFLGPIAKMRECLFVDRAIMTDREWISDAIKKRGEDFFKGKSEIPLVIFSEGTTTNGKYLLKFRRGAFTPMLPIKPVFVKSPFIPFLQNSVEIGVMSNFLHLALCFSNFYNLVVSYEIPIITPNQHMIDTFKEKLLKRNCDLNSNPTYSNEGNDLLNKNDNIDKNSKENTIIKRKKSDDLLINTTSNENEEKIDLSSTKYSNELIYCEVVKDIMSRAGGFKKSEKSFNEMLMYISNVRGYTIKNT